MALADRLAQPESAIHGKDCSVALLLRALPPADRAALEAALVDRSFTNMEIWRAVRAEGHEAGRNSIRYHRAGQCRCSS